MDESKKARLRLLREIERQKEETRMYNAWLCVNPRTVKKYQPLDNKTKYCTRAD